MQTSPVKKSDATAIQVLRQPPQCRSCTAATKAMPSITRAGQWKGQNCCNLGQLLHSFNVGSAKATKGKHIHATVDPVVKFNHCILVLASRSGASASAPCQAERITSGPELGKTLDPLPPWCRGLQEQALPLASCSRPAYACAGPGPPRWPLRPSSWEWTRRRLAKPLPPLSGHVEGVSGARCGLHLLVLAVPGTSLPHKYYGDVGQAGRLASSAPGARSKTSRAVSSASIPQAPASWHDRRGTTPTIG
eukprot:scaffold2051_cov389-Prasinococcus_capsulatus_cf.AAC.16